MSRPERGSASGQTVVLALLLVGIGVVAWLSGRRAERAALLAKAESAQTETAAPVDPAPAPARPAASDALEERSATLEVAVAVPAAEPTSEPAFLSEPPSRDDPARCLTLEASPSFVTAYGASGPAAQLVVRARNACASAFSGRAIYFRAVAVSMEGSELASATGRFNDEIRPYSTAETLVAIETDLTRVRLWRVELR